MGSTRIIYLLFIVFVQVYGFPCKSKDIISKRNNIYRIHDLLHRPDLSIQPHGLSLSRLLHRAGFYQKESPATLNSYGGSNQVYQNSDIKINDFDRANVETANAIRNYNSWRLLNKKAFLLGTNSRLQNILHRNNFPVNYFHSFGWHNTYHGIPYDTHNEDHIVVKKPAVFPQVVSPLLKKDGNKVSDVEAESEHDSAKEKTDRISTNENIAITENSLQISNTNGSTTEESQTLSTNVMTTTLKPAVTNLPDNYVTEFLDTTFTRLSTETITMTEDLFTENVDSCSSKIMSTLRSVFYENFETTESTVIADSRPEITTQRTTTAFTTTESGADISSNEETWKIETTLLATDDYVVEESSGSVMLLTTDQYISEATTTTAPATVDAAEAIGTSSTLSEILSFVDTLSRTTNNVQTEEVSTEISSTVDLNMATEVSETATTMGISITTDFLPDVSRTVLLDENYEKTTENGPTELYVDETHLLQLIPRVIQGLKNDYTSANEKEILSQLYGKLWPYLVEESNRKEDEPMNEMLASFLESFSLMEKEENSNGRIKRENDFNLFEDIKRSQGLNDLENVNRSTHRIA